ncbi:DUF4342 domain-containing protein [Occultella kanbiaonis]|uniref:DUF4342 domain-containing protein n=1 Tax=Occultella kanbiaonis TaxID=2675754 RepID=UPI0013D2D67E|nr:DUF4342 domain-containing protein [Occultella kanbiaonis]
MDEKQNEGEKTWYEEFSVSGSELLDKVKGLVHEGNVRRLYIKNGDGRTLLEIPLTAGVAITAVTAVIAPVLVAVGAVAALLTKVTLGVEREGEAAPDAADPAPADQDAPGIPGVDPAPDEDAR